MSYQYPLLFDWVLRAIEHFHDNSFLQVGTHPTLKLNCVSSCLVTFSFETNSGFALVVWGENVRCYQKIDRGIDCYALYRLKRF